MSDWPIVSANGGLHWRVRDVLFNVFRRPAQVGPKFSVGDEVAWEVIPGSATVYRAKVVALDLRNPAKVRYVLRVNCEKYMDRLAEEHELIGVPTSPADSACGSHL